MNESECIKKKNSLPIIKKRKSPKFKYLLKNSSKMNSPGNSKDRKSKSKSHNEYKLSEIGLSEKLTNKNSTKDTTRGSLKISMNKKTEQNEKSNYEFSVGNPNKVEMSNGITNSFNIDMGGRASSPKNGNEFGSFKKNNEHNIYGNQHQTKSKTDRFSKKVTNIECNFPGMDLSKSLMTLLLSKDTTDFLSKTLNKLDELMTFHKKISTILEKEIRIQSDLCSNDIMIRVTEKIDRMEHSEKAFKSKIKSLKAIINQLEDEKEGKNKEISQILSRMDETTSNLARSRGRKPKKFEIACTGSCKYKKGSFYQVSTHSLNQLPNEECTCYLMDEHERSEEYLNKSVRLEKTLSKEKKKRKNLEKEILKCKQEQSKMTRQNLEALKDNHNIQKMLVVEKEKIKDLKSKYESHLEILKSNIGNVNVMRSLLSKKEALLSDSKLPGNESRFADKHQVEQDKQTKNHEKILSNYKLPIKKKKRRGKLNLNSKRNC